MDNQRPPLTQILVMTAVLTVGLLGMEFLFSDEQGASPSGAADAGVSASPDASAREDVEQPPSQQPDTRINPSAELSERELRARWENQERFTLNTQYVSAEVSNLNTGLVRLTVLNERFGQDGELHQMVTTDREEFLPLRISVGGVNIPEDALWQGEQVSPTEVRFSWSGNGFTVYRRLSVIDDAAHAYQIWSTVRIVNRGETTRPVRLNTFVNHYVLRSEESGGALLAFASRSPAISETICAHGEDLTRSLRGDDDAYGERSGYGPDVGLAGVGNAFFALALAPDGAPAERCRLEWSNRGVRDTPSFGTLFGAQLMYPRAELEGGESVTYRTLAYVGPKDMDAIQTSGHQMSDLVDLGWFDPIAGAMVTLLGVLSDFTGNWGFAIILLTVLVRLMLFPLTEKSMRSMARMRHLKPEMDRINELYKDDREAKGAATMELYRKEKINPLGGCAPMLLQMPIFFALYQSLMTNVELFNAPFVGWLTDLSASDPYYVLPVSLGVLMFLQQRLAPTGNMDPMQRKMMMFAMPIFITAIMLVLPAGLCLYMVTSSALGIAQQKWIHYRLDRDAAESQGPDANDDGSSSSKNTKDAGSSSSKSARKRTRPTSSSDARPRNKKQRSNRGRNQKSAS